MIAALWKASDEGDLPRVQEILSESPPPDLEAKDPATSATPLVQAVQNGHVEIVRALLDAGADPESVYAYRAAEPPTTDATILSLLTSAKEKKQQPTTDAAPYYPPEGYAHEYPADPAKAYYSQPHGSYMYYPPVMPGATFTPEGGAPYYPPPPPSGQPINGANGSGSLPPPEIARLIPCRYFPACRYGPSCMFAHPQGPYFQGPLPPPAHYATSYDPMSQPYPTGYYAAAYPPNGVPPPPPTNPMSPPPQHSSAGTPQNHARSGSEIVSPVPAPYNPPGPAPGIPYGISLPPPYAQPPQMPMGLPIASLPPHPHAHTPSQPNVIYPPTSPVVQTAGATMIHSRDPSLAQNIVGQVHVTDINGVSHLPTSAPQNNPSAGMNRPLQQREGMNMTRRVNGRRTSSIGLARKPPCLFFPSGRCRNGDDCRFPHILPDGNGPSSVPHYQSKFARSRPPNGVPGDSLDEKMSALSLRQDGPNGVEAQQLDAGPNGRPQYGYKQITAVNGARSDKRAPTMTQRQRIPNADDFPVLAGTTTPPLRGLPVHVTNGPTAAQVLQAPAPVKKDALKTPPNGSAEPVRTPPTPKDEISAKETIDVHVNGVNDVIKPPTFASVATSAAGTPPDASSQVSVSA